MQLKKLQKLMITNIESNCLDDKANYLFNINSIYRLPIHVQSVESNNLID